MTATQVLFIYRTGTYIFSIDLFCFFIGSLQRYDIVNGVVEVEGVTTEADVDQEEDKATGGTWLLAYCSNFYLITTIIP